MSTQTLERPVQGIRPTTSGRPRFAIGFAVVLVAISMAFVLVVNIMSRGATTRSPARNVPVLVPAHVPPTGYGAPFTPSHVPPGGYGTDQALIPSHVPPGGYGRTA